MKEKKEFYSVPELAQLMHMSRVGVFKKVKRGEIKAKKIGKSYAIPASEACLFVSEEEPARYGEKVFFRERNGSISLDVSMKNDTIWLNLNQMAVLFGRDKSVVSRHIENVFKEGELSRDKSTATFAVTRIEGNEEVERQEVHYNLDVLVSAGYRVKSKAGLQFREWATKILVKYLANGFVLNEEKLRENPEKKEKIIKELRRI